MSVLIEFMSLLFCLNTSAVQRPKCLVASMNKGTLMF